MTFRNLTEKLKQITIPVLIILVTILVIPLIFKYQLKLQDESIQTVGESFPVTVDFSRKTIVENPSVDAYLNSKGSPLAATALFSGAMLEKVFSVLAISISKITGNSNLALVGGNKFITITPGLRKEEVAKIFGKELNWSEAQSKEFLNPQENSNLPLAEGSYFPGIYSVGFGTTPIDVKNMINNRFNKNIVSRYGTTTADKVPLEVALKVASLIQRETIGTDDMRVVSGIIWNRIFANMNLQLDATLQYAKANTNKTSVWWPKIFPNDKYIKSPYNTYLHSGLTPTAIANPSVAAVLAALNPIKTDCLFYFHDKRGEIHCAPTYKEHVTLLKQYYGKGE